MGQIFIQLEKIKYFLNRKICFVWKQSISNFLKLFMRFVFEIIKKYSNLNIIVPKEGLEESCSFNYYYFHKKTLSGSSDWILIVDMDGGTS